MWAVFTNVTAPFGIWSILFYEVVCASVLACLQYEDSWSKPFYELIFAWRYNEILIFEEFYKEVHNPLEDEKEKAKKLSKNYDPKTYITCIEAAKTIEAFAIVITAGSYFNQF